MEQLQHRQIHPLLMIVFIMLAVGAGFLVIGPLIGFMLAVPFYNGNVLDLAKALESPDESIKIPFYIIQGTTSLIGLILIPLLLLKTIFLTDVRKVFPFQHRDWAPMALIPFIVLCFIAAVSFFVEWNANVHLPDFMKNFEDWARSKEELAADITSLLTTFDSFGVFLLALMVIAVLPAIGEELVFRGFIQRLFIQANINPHVAIWLAAILFSAIHIQFFGFVPRLFLGALFGYLYYWSGNLYMAVLAHFINNGLAVVGLYLYQQGAHQYDFESNESLPLSYILLGLVSTIGLLYYFKRYYEKEHTSNAAEM